MDAERRAPGTESADVVFAALLVEHNLLGCSSAAQVLVKAFAASIKLTKAPGVTEREIELVVIA